MFSYSNSDEIVDFYFKNYNYINENAINENQNENNNKKNIEIEIKDFNDYETIYNKFYNYNEEEIDSIIDEILIDYSKENFIKRSKRENINNNENNITKEENIQNETLNSSNNNNNNNEISNDKNYEEIDINLIPTFKNNLDFIDYIEYEQKNKIPIDKEKNNILSNYFTQSKSNIELLNIESIEKLNSYLKINQKKENEITCILTKGKLLFFGDIYGNVCLFSILDSTLIKYLQCPIKELVQLSVNCFDLTSNGEFIIIGYICGYISIFDIGREKCLLLINNVHKSYYLNQKFELNSILDIKFYDLDKNYIYFYVSDKIGDVFLDSVKMGNKKFKLEKYKSLGKNSEKIYGKNPEPVFLIKLMKFPKYVYDQYPLLNKIEKNVIFVSISNIRIFNCKNDEKPILTIKKPSYLNDDDVCTDVNIGIGKVNLNNFSFNLEENDSDEIELLLITSWGKIIYLIVQLEELVFCKKV